MVFLERDNQMVAVVVVVAAVVVAVMVAVLMLAIEIDWNLATPLGAMDVSLWPQ